MKTHRCARDVALVLVAVWGLQSSAQAGVITSVTSQSLPGSSTGTIGPVGATPAPNNDNATGASPNVIPSSVFYNSPGMVETEFAVSDGGGATEYRFTQNLVNNSGQAWTGFVFELGYGTGASFVRSTGADALDFDTPDKDPAPTSPFTTRDHQGDLLQWSGGTVPSVGAAAFSLAVDVPDLGPGGRFTLRQIPVVAIPEPATTALFGLGLGLLGVIARKRAIGA